MTVLKAAASHSRMVQDRDKQKGYALLMAIFLVATMIILVMVATPSILTEGRREREQESIWRGNQYVRAIELYYRKNGHYPQTVDDLMMGNPGVHFLRKAYTDPMNSEDGSWRFIYISSAGQLIGSVRYHNLQEMALMQNMPGAGQALPNANAGAAGQPGADQQGAAQQQAAQQGIGQPGATATDQQAGTGLGPGLQQAGSGGTVGANQQGSTPSGASAQGFAPTQGSFASSFGSTQSTQSGFGSSQSTLGSPQSGFGSPQPTSGLSQPTSIPLQAVDGPVLGANLIGVAGKVKRASLIFYQGGRTYFEWEFIYNPLSVVAVGGQPGAVAIPPVTPPGTNGPAGTSPGVPQVNPFGAPPTTGAPQ